MTADDRKAGAYVIRNSMHIGKEEVVLGENTQAEPGQRYMTAYCQMNEIFAQYDEVLVSDDYAEIVQIFGERVNLKHRRAIRSRFKFAQHARLLRFTQSQSLVLRHAVRI